MLTAASSWAIATALSAPRSYSEWTPKDSINLVAIVGAFIVVVVLGGMLLMYLRRRMNERESALQAPGSIMEELRRLRKQGLLSEAEYEASRRAATAKLSAATMPQTAPAPPPRTSRPRPRPAAPPARTADRQAPPGYDLTGEPLPKPPPDSR